MSATKKISRVVAYLSLIVLCVMVVVYLAGNISLDRLKTIMTAATGVWFVAAALWMWKDNGQ